MIRLLNKFSTQIILAIALAVCGLSTVFLVNRGLGYNPDPVKLIRNFLMILTLLPFIYIFRLIGYKGSFRLLLIAIVLTAIGLTLRFDYEIKKDYNKSLKAETVQADISAGSFADDLKSQVSSLAKTAAGFIGCLLVYLFFRKNPGILLRRYMIMSMMVILFLAAYFIWTKISGQRFFRNTTPWDFMIPLLVLILSASLTENSHGLTDLRWGLFPRAIYWVPLLIVWLIPAAMFVLIKELGVFLILGTILILMLYLSTKKPAYLLLSSAIIILSGWLVIKFDLAGGHVGVRLSLWADFWRGFPENLPANAPFINSREFMRWVGPPYLRGQHLSSFFAIWHGGVFGTGLGTGYPNAIPQATTDFMAPVIVESLGLTGLLVVTAFFCSYAMHCFKLADKAEGRFLQLALQGFGILFLTQFFISTAGTFSILPMTGVPIPFVARSNTLVMVTYMVIGYIMAVEDKVGDGAR